MAISISKQSRQIGSDIKRARSGIREVVRSLDNEVESFAQIAENYANAFNEANALVASVLALRENLGKMAHGADWHRLA